MSEQTEIEKLKRENEGLKNNVSNLQETIAGHIAQIQAHRELLNESTNTACIVRTNFILLKKENSKIGNELARVNGLLASANKAIETLKKEIEGLKKPAEVPPSVEEPVAA